MSVLQLKNYFPRGKDGYSNFEDLIITIPVKITLLSSRTVTE